MDDERITSFQNSRVKQVCALQQKAAERRRTGLFIVEGRREVERCAAAGYEIACLFRCAEIEEASAQAEAFAVSGQTEVFSVSPQIYEKMAYRGTTEGLLAVVRQKTCLLTDLPERGADGEEPLLVVLESVEKPGNLGAVLRSADAARATAVIVCDPRCDIFNPNLIRSSLGARFSLPVIACTSEECIAFLKQRGIQILTAQLQDSSPYYTTDMRRATALVMGTESTGLTQQWRNAADAHIVIPMRGTVDSLNVSVSTAILLFEAVRQRLTGGQE